MKIEQIVLKCNECDVEVGPDEVPKGWITIVEVPHPETLLRGSFRIDYSNGKSFHILAHIKDQLDFCSTRCILSWTESLRERI